MDQKFRILMVAPQFRPLVGGYERAAERLSNELGRRGHIVTVVTERRDSRWPSTEDCGTYSLSRLWCVHRRGVHLFTSLLSYSIFLMRNGPRFDVFHVHQYGYHAALTVLFGRLFRKPVILKITNTGPEGIQRTMGRYGWVCELLSDLHRQVDACVATTAAGRNEAERFGISPERIAIIPNGLDTDDFVPRSGSERQDIKRRLGIHDPLVVLFSGRLSKGKNVTGLVEAWQVVRAKIPKATLVLLGEGPLRSSLERQIAESGLRDGFMMCGSHVDVLPWYQVADVFVLPSAHEGLSNSLLEAMSCGVPVVSTKVSGSAEIFAECDIGEMVATGSHDALADALSCLLLAEDRREACADRARRYAVENFSIGEVAQKTEHLYAAVAAIVESKA